MNHMLLRRFRVLKCASHIIFNTKQISSQLCRQNLYGPNDNYNLETSHVLPALIRKMHLGKCLENNDWVALREDLRKAIEGVNGNSNESEILQILGKYGIKLVENIQGPAPT